MSPRPTGLCQRRRSGRRPRRTKPEHRQANDLLGDRLVVGLRTLTPSAGVRIPLPQPHMKNPALRRVFHMWLGERIDSNPRFEPSRRRARWSVATARRASGRRPRSNPSQPSVAARRMPKPDARLCAGFFIMWLGERDRCAARASGRSYPEPSAGNGGFAVCAKRLRKYSPATPFTS
jgi:hypothetical protein